MAIETNLLAKITGSKGLKGCCRSHAMNWPTRPPWFLSHQWSLPILSVPDPRWVLVTNSPP